MLSSLFKLSSITCLASGLVLSLVNPGHPNEPAKDNKVDYAKVDQIFRLYDCIDCHTSGTRPASGLSLTTYEGLMKGGKRGAAITAGKSDDSLLMKILSPGNTPHMPPGNSQLRPEFIETLKKWIDQGVQNSPYGEALTRYYTASHDKKWSDALAACDDIEKVKVEGVHTWAVAARNRIPIYTLQKDEDGWYKAAKSLVGKEPINGIVSNDIAWTIVDPQTWLKHRDLDLAQIAADNAVKNTGRQSGAILDTLAWVYFQKGDKAKAIEIETEAMKCEDAKGATLDALKDSMKAFGG